jgi:flagellar FliL protein
VKAHLPKILLIIAGLAVGAGVMFGATQMLGIGKSKDAAVEKELPPVGIMFPLRDRVVNLTDPGMMRYLKVGVTLDIKDPKLKEPPKGEEYKKKQEHLTVEMKGHLPQIEDQVTVILSSKSSGELISAEGKQKLKDELKEKLNKALHEDLVLGVYFTDFIIQ